MHIEVNDLENRLGNLSVPEFKSKGERKIAYFLDQNDIKYQYEPAVLVRADQEKQRIWYPDFYLPEFKMYIEYFGMIADQNYARGVKTKQAVYSKAGHDVISIYPWMLKENWQGYIMQQLEKGTILRYRNLMTKPYWNPSRSPPANSYSRSFYRRPSNRKY
jgi:hypothetical protein